MQEQTVNRCINIHVKMQSAMKCYMLVSLNGKGTVAKHWTLLVNMRVISSAIGMQCNCFWQWFTYIFYMHVSIGRVMYCITFSYLQCSFLSVKHFYKIQYVQWCNVYGKSLTQGFVARDTCKYLWMIAKWSHGVILKMILKNETCKHEYAF